MEIMAVYEPDIKAKLDDFRRQQSEKVLASTLPEV